MKLIYVEELPERKPLKNLQELVEEFCESGRVFAKIEWTANDYKDAKSCYGSMTKAVRASKRPVKVRMRGGDIYLTKI